MPDRRPSRDVVGRPDWATAGAPTVAVIRFEVPTESPDFTSQDLADFTDGVDRVLAALAQAPGFRGGWAGRAVDDPAGWLLTSEWDGPGGWRRALSGFEVRRELTPLLVHAVDAPGTYEVLVARGGADAHARTHASDLAPDAATTGPGSR